MLDGAMVYFQEENCMISDLTACTIEYKSTGGVSIASQFSIGTRVKRG